MFVDADVAQAGGRRFHTAQMHETGFELARRSRKTSADV
jgi:hypothetical protein